MFTANIYADRRVTLQKLVGSGVILLLGHKESPVNYSAVTYPFRQDSTFLYYFGFNYPNLAGIIDIDNDKTVLFGQPQSSADLVWSGEQPALRELGIGADVHTVKDISQLEKYIKNIVRQKRRLHLIPSYRSDSDLMLSQLLNIPILEIKQKISDKLIRSIVKQRSKKSIEEINEIKQAIKISQEFDQTIRSIISSEIYEYNILAEYERIATNHNTRLSFQPTISIHGEFLHNLSYNNKLKAGRLLLVDSGVESPNHYTSDITRIYPISKKFTNQQKAIYNLVLDTQIKAIKQIKPGVLYRDIHLNAAKNIFNGLKDMNITKGNVEEAIREGAGLTH